MKPYPFERETIWEWVNKCINPSLKKRSSRSKKRPSHSKSATTHGLDPNMPPWGLTSTCNKPHFRWPCCWQPMVDSDGPTSAAQFSSVKPPIFPQVNLPIDGHSPGKPSETNPSTGSARICRNYTTKQVLGMGLARSKPMKKTLYIIYKYYIYIYIYI